MVLPKFRTDRVPRAPPSPKAVSPKAVKEVIKPAVMKAKRSSATGPAFGSPKKVVAKPQPLATPKGGKANGRKIRIGFLVGKDNDPVPHGTHPKDIPAKICFADPKGNGWGGKYHVDSVVAWRVAKSFPEVVSDPIPPSEVTLQRLKKNDVNFVIGADYLNARLADPKKGDSSAHAKKVLKALKSKEGKCFPDWKLQDWVYWKNKYMKQCMKAGVPMLPTIFLGSRPDCKKLLKDIKARGWKRFVIKPEMSCWSIGFLAAYTSECEEDPSKLEEHFARSKMPAYLVQEFLESKEFPGQSFSEVRCWWINGEFSHAAETTAQDETKGIDGIVIPPPKSDLAQAVEVGRRAMEQVMKVSKFQGKSTPPPLIRTDIGVCDFQIKGLSTGKKRTFFLNEIENMGTNWLTRYHANDAKGLRGRSYPEHRGFDMVDRMSEYVVKKANELCGDGKPVELSWTPGTFGGVRTGKWVQLGKGKAAMKRKST